MVVDEVRDWAEIVRLRQIELALRSGANIVVFTHANSLPGGEAQDLVFNVYGQ